MFKAQNAAEAVESFRFYHSGFLKVVQANIFVFLDVILKFKTASINIEYCHVQ